LPPAASIQLDKVMPNLEGISKRDLLTLLQLESISVIIEGDGWVVSQRPPPGTPIIAGMTIELMLE